MKKLTRREAELLIFAQKHKHSYHSVAGAAIRTARSLAKKGLLEFVEYEKAKPQFRHIEHA